MKAFEKRLPDAELSVMKVVWHEPNPISTSEVKAVIDKESGKLWTGQTLQTLLNRLLDKGFLEKGKRGKEYIYSFLVSEKDYIEYESDLFLKKMHGNSVSSLVRALFDSNKISKDDIDELERLFKEMKND